MIILGVSCEHDSGAALLADGEIIAAANEERFCRQKMVTAPPIESIRNILLTSGVHAENIDTVALSSIMHMPESMWDWDGISLTSRLLETLIRIRAGGLLAARPLIRGALLTHRGANTLSRIAGVKRFLKELGIQAPVSIVDHHDGHAYSAYGTAGWEDCLVLTLDGQGDGACSKVAVPELGRLKTVQVLPWYHSPCYYYSCITRLLGFKFGREGKVTGLAAFGDASKTIRVFEDRITLKADSVAFLSNRRGYRNSEIENLRALLDSASPEDIAAGMQKHFERLIVAYVRGVIHKLGGTSRKLALAGGAFANVRLNQELAQLPEVQELFVHPHMGDGGLAAGSAFACWARLNSELGRSWIPRRLQHVYLGPESTDEELSRLLHKKGIDVTKAVDIESEIARRLAEGKVVGRFAGRMEYGPRALGNRSILCSAADPSMNARLNARLKRTEFMPFAPVVREERLTDFFSGAEKSPHALEFMTITLNATGKCIREAPAVVHVDGTARPQVIKKAVNPSYYQILKKYEEMSGLGVLINTSFNIHEEPIVSNPEDALTVLQDGALDALAMGDYIIDWNGQTGTCR